MSDNEKNTDPILTENPVSGETAGAVQTAPKKKSCKWGIVAAAVAVVAAIAVAVVLFAGSSPLGLVGTGFRNSVKALESNPAVSLFHGVANGGSTEVSVDLATITEALDSYLMLDGSAFTKIYTDRSANKMAVTAGVKLDQMEEFDIGLFLSENNLALSSKWLLGEDAYGVNFQDFAKNFEDSVFGMDGEYSLGIELPEENKNLAAELKQYSEDSTKLAVDLSAKLLGIIEANAEIDQENAVLTLNGKEVKTSAVSVELEHEQLFAVSAQALEYLRTDKDIRTYLETYAEYLLSATEGYAVDRDEALDFIDEFYDELDQICEEELDDLAATLEESDASVLVTFHITKSGKQLVGIEFEAEVDDEAVSGYVYAGPDLKNPEEISCRIKVDDETYRATYTVSTNTADKFESELRVRADNETVFKAELIWDKKDGDFEIEASDSWDEYIVKGSLEQSGKAASVTVKSVSADGEKIKLNTTVAFNPSDKMPPEPAYTDVLTMSADEVDEVIGDLMEVIEELVYGFYW